MAYQPVRYAHVSPGRLMIYRGGYGLGADGPESTVPLPPGSDRDATLGAASAALARLGWGLARDGWRTPLDPTAGLLATAHLIELDQRNP